MELLTRQQVAARLTVAPRTLDKLRNRPDFPQPIPITAKALRWRADHIDAWIVAQASMHPVARPARGGRRSAAELMG